MKEISAIYEAVDDEEAFARIPHILASAAGARSAILQVFSSDWTLQEVQLSYFSAEMLNRYTDLELWRLDPWRAPAARSLNQILTMDDAVPVERIAHSTFYKENFEYWGDDTARCLAGAYKVDQHILSVGVHSGLRAPAFSDVEHARISALAPHVQKLFEIRARIGSLDQRARLSEAALDAQSNAILIVDLHGLPYFMNMQATELIASNEILSLSSNGLQLRNSDQARRFKQALRSACERTGGHGASFLVARQEASQVRELARP